MRGGVFPYNFFSGLRPNLRPKDPLSVTQLKFPVVSREGKLLFTLGHTTITFLILSLTTATNTVFSYGTYLFTSNFDLICRGKNQSFMLNPCSLYSAINFLLISVTMITFKRCLYVCSRHPKSDFGPT